MSDSDRRPSVAFVMPHGILMEVFGTAGVERASRSGRLVHPPIETVELLANEHPWTREVEVLLTSWGGPVMDGAMLSRFPNLKGVFYGAGSSKRMTTPEFWARDILLTTAAAANAVPVAEYTVAAMVMGLKQAWASDRRTRDTKTFSRRPFEPEGLYGSRVGLVSLGLIGRLVRERLRAYDVDVVAYDPFVSVETFQRLEIKPLSLEELFSTSSVVSIHTPVLPETKGLVTAELVASMKTNATLINTARGVLVKEEEVCGVLRDRPDLQAVFDVTYPEPPAPESLLYRLPNVFLTPHLAGSRGSERLRLGDAMLAEFERYCRGERLAHAVDQAQESLTA